MQEMREESSTPTGGGSTSVFDKRYLTTLILGIIIGAACISMVGITTYLMNYVCIVGDGCLSIETVEVWPPPEVMAGICPPCESILGTATPTPSPKLAPDLDATATAACADFSSQFPGTPCPSQ
jgi:hypothetical protein